MVEVNLERCLQDKSRAYPLQHRPVAKVRLGLRQKQGPNCQIRFQAADAKQLTPPRRPLSL